MARRKRLGPAMGGAETETNSRVSDVIDSVTPESKSALRPPGNASFGAPPPIARVAAETSAEAALSEISEAMARARAEGRLIVRLPVAVIEAEHLVRDRVGIDEEALEGLVASIREHGQRNPIEVSEIAPGRYGLISGWRRLTALRRLSREGDSRFEHVLALVRQPETAADAYIAMVEENEIRLGLSYYERARIAARAVEQGVFPDEREALRRLFANASRARRSKIGSFLALYHKLDAVLRFPAAIPERLGLLLEKRLQEADSAVSETFLNTLSAEPSADAASEIERLTRFAEGENVSRAKHSPVIDEGKARSNAGAEICPGIFLIGGGRGTARTLTLSGPGLDHHFQARLEAWLTSEV